MAVPAADGPIAQLGVPVYAASGKGKLSDIWHHFTTRGHKGRVQAIDANFQADIIATGGTDYTVRVWQYNSRFDAYDLIVLHEHVIPLNLRPTGQGIGFLTSLKQMAFPPKGDMEGMPPLGVTSVTSTGSAKFPNSITKTVRLGPVLSGNVHGDFYITCLCAEEAPIPPLMGLHEGRINDVVAVVDRRQHVNGECFRIMTCGDDNSSYLLEMLCEEVETPSFDNHVPFERHEFVETMFFGGGGRKGAREKRDEENSGSEEVRAMRCVSIAKRLRCSHSSPVLRVRSLVGNKQARSEDATSFATVTKEGVKLFNMDGIELRVLSIGSELGTKYHELNAPAATAYSVRCEEHLDVASVNKEGGSLLFVSGCALDGHKVVAAWGFEEGDIGIKNMRPSGENDSGMVYCRGLLYGQDKKKAIEEGATQGADANGIEPICVYRRAGSLLEIDQSGLSTTFAVQLQKDGLTVDMWNLEACQPGLLVIEPEGPSSLLRCPGTENTILQLNHVTKVIDMRVVEDPEGPALATACENGVGYMWDLEGDDAGQCYAELRSLKPQEIVLPVFQLLVTAAQVLSFAFGPAVPWTEEVHQPATVAHNFMMLDFKFTIKINKEDIFWPEMHIITSAIMIFIVLALTGIPAILDGVVQNVESSQTWKTEVCCGLLYRPARKGARFLRTSSYLAMQLLSTVLVVPMLQSCAQAVDCVWPEGTHWLDLLTMAPPAAGNPERWPHLSVAPNVHCYTGAHFHLFALLLVIMVPYIILLVPFAVCGGDAHYMPTQTLFNFKWWKEDSAWRNATKRKATSVHLGFLHIAPAHAFETLFLELTGKIMLPVITTWTTARPLLQMALVSTIGCMLWVNSITNFPYVERKFCVLVQDLKLFTLWAMLCGLFTVWHADATSRLPIFLLGGGFLAVLIFLPIQLWMIGAAMVEAAQADMSATGSTTDQKALDRVAQVGRPCVKRYQHDVDLAAISKKGSDEEAPLLEAQARTLISGE